jgi:prepilin-type N-terminal cleavage/methylation domain-containing protein
MLKRVKGFTLIELLIVVAIIAILAAIAVPNFLEAQTRAKVARARADLRTMATALETYYVDNVSYPGQSSSIRSSYVTTGTGVFGINDGTTAGDTFLLLRMPTFRRKIDGNDRMLTLTTPVSYISNYFPDPFATTKGAFFNYSRSPTVASGWIMWSFGPDTDQEDPQAVTPQGGENFGGDIVCINVGSYPYVDTNYYNPSLGNPTPSLVANSTYDPTNGTDSSGDVYRIKD